MKIDEDRAFMFASSVLTVALCTLVGMLAGKRHCLEPFCSTGVFALDLHPEHKI
jgi:hypothetical protein